MHYADIQAALREKIDPAKAAFYPRFFKSGPGQYGEGDMFLGVVVPDIRAVVREYRTLPLSEIRKLLESKWHEDRMAALFILNWQFPRADTRQQAAIYDLYISHTRFINNWDLVDLSAPYIVGPYLNNKPEKMSTLTKLAHSDMLWERRIAMLATFYYIRQGRADEALDIIGILLHNSHDLIQKATGWMLREIGKRVDRDILLNYLDNHAATMPRVTLRYSIEHLPDKQRQTYLAMKNLDK